MKKMLLQQKTCLKFLLVLSFLVLVMGKKPLMGEIIDDTFAIKALYFQKKTAAPTGTVRVYRLEGSITGSLQTPSDTNLVATRVLTSISKDSTTHLTMNTLLNGKNAVIFNLSSTGTVVTIPVINMLDWLKSSNNNAVAFIASATSVTTMQTYVFFITGYASITPIDLSVETLYDLTLSKGTGLSSSLPYITGSGTISSFETLLLPLIDFSVMPMLL